MNLKTLGQLLSPFLSKDKLEKRGKLAAFETGCNSIADDANMADVLAQIAEAFGMPTDAAKALLKGLGDIAHDSVRGGLFG